MADGRFLSQAIGDITGSLGRRAREKQARENQLADAIALAQLKGQIASQSAQGTSERNLANQIALARAQSGFKREEKGEEREFEAGQRQANLAQAGKFMKQFGQVGGGVAGGVSPTQAGQPLAGRQFGSMGLQPQTEETSRFIPKRSVTTDPFTGKTSITMSQVENPLFKQKREDRIRAEARRAELEDFETKERTKKQIDLEFPTTADKKFDIGQQEQKKKEKLQSEAVIASAQDMLNTIDTLSTSENIKRFGFTGPIPAIPGTGKREWLAELNYLKGKQVLQLMTQLRQASKTGATGFGQLSEKELLLLQNSANKLETGLSSDAATKELNRVKGLLKKVLTKESGKTLSTTKIIDQPTTIQIEEARQKGAVGFDDVKGVFVDANGNPMQ